MTPFPPVGTGYAASYGKISFGFVFSTYIGKPFSSELNQNMMKTKISRLAPHPQVGGASWGGVAGVNQTAKLTADLCSGPSNTL